MVKKAKIKKKIFKRNPRLKKNVEKGDRKETSKEEQATTTPKGRKKKAQTRMTITVIPRGN